MGQFGTAPNLMRNIDEKAHQNKINPNLVCKENDDFKNVGLVKYVIIS